MCADLARRVSPVPLYYPTHVDRYCCQQASLFFSSSMAAMTQKASGIGFSGRTVTFSRTNENVFFEEYWNFRTDLNLVFLILCNGSFIIV